MALIQSWSKEDLLALLKEVEEFAVHADSNIAKFWRDHATKSEFFFRKNALALDRMRDDANLLVLEACAEISSVAQMYLKQNYGIELPLDDDDASLMLT